MTGPIIPSATSGLPNRILGLEVNRIVDIADMARDDPEVIKLWVGESDLPTPGFISDAAVAALHEGRTHYTYALGVPPLRQALADYHSRHWGVRIPAERFSITIGGMNAIMQVLQSVVEPSDEVVYPSPAWPNLLQAIRIVGGRGVPVLFDFRSGKASLDLDRLFAAVTERTKVIAINSPSNPTGWVMPAEDMVRLRDFARQRGLWIVADEVYSHYVYGASVAPSFLQIMEPGERLFVTNTFSKNWAMTGWRAGWVIYPEGLDETFDKLSQYNTTGIPEFIQYGAIAALTAGDGFVRHMVERAGESGAIMARELTDILQKPVTLPDGTFYLFVDASAFGDGRQLAISLLRHAKVGVSPGMAFGPGGEPFVRFCFAVSPERAREAMARVRKHFNQVRPAA